MPMKKHLNLSVDNFLVDEAKKKRLNLSEVLESALTERIVQLEKIEIEKGYPFEVCEENIPDHLKKSLWGCVSIKARRCGKCDKIFFVNDPHGEFKVCKHCWGKSEEVEVKWHG